MIVFLKYAALSAKKSASPGMSLPSICRQGRLLLVAYVFDKKSADTVKINSKFQAEVHNVESVVESRELHSQYTLSAL